MMLLPKGLRSTTFFLHNKSISYSLLSAVACLLVSYAGLWLINYDNNKQQQRFINYHGAIVNKLMVKQLASAMANNDLIGMQSLLQGLDQKQNIVNAIIYDINNTVIVQSGEINPRPLASHYSFTSPIVLEDSHLGSLTTTVNISFQTKFWLFLLIIIGAALPLLLLTRLLFREENIHIANTTNVAQADNVETKVEIPSPLFDGFLLIKIHTLDKVYKQLNAQARSKEFKTLETLLNHVLTLYSGEKIALNHDIIIIKFSREDKNKLLFDAICSAYLLLELAKENRLFTKLSAILYSHQPTISLSIDIPLLTQLHQPNTIYVNHLLEDNTLEGRVILESNKQDSFQKVVGFSEKHQSLLSNQLLQLLKMR